MVHARTLSRLLAAAFSLALSACAQQGAIHANGAAAAGTVIPAEGTGTAAPTTAQDAGAATTTDTAATAAAAPTEAPAPVATKAAPAQSAASTASTEADYQALYGDTSGASTDQGSLQPWDPWEKFNRKMHAVNNTVDHAMIHPVALTYAHVVPRPLRTGVSNFFRNLGGPANVVNSLLQGKPSQAGGSLFRFLVNSTFGVGGLLDVATKIHIPDRSNDFGRTLAAWGWKNSRYLELPVFGPRTVRDAASMAVDMPLNPLRSSQSLVGQVALRTINVIDIRAQLLSTDAMREGAFDDYRLLRDAWWQRRNYQIQDDRASQGATELPDYLQTAPTKPD